MTVRTPIVIAAAVVLGLSACGEGGAGGGPPGATAASFEEPVDAVPLPLDDNPLTLPPVAQPVVAAEKKTEDAKVETDTAEGAILVTPPPAAAQSPAPASTPRPAPAPTREAPRPAPAPTPQPAPSPEPRSEGERPVLNF